MLSKKWNFFKIVKDMKISYKYSYKNQQKIPDLVIKIKGKLLILEAKHIKESGGA